MCTALYVDGPAIEVNLDHNERDDAAVIDIVGRYSIDVREE